MAFPSASMTKAQVLMAALLAAGVAAVYSSTATSSVVNLHTDNYDDSVSDGKVYFIKYFAPWCGHCKRLAPTWDELAAELKNEPNIVIANVDCTIARDVCTAADVKGYPTLKVIHAGQEYKAYRGVRELPALKKFAVDSANELLKES